MPPPRGRSPSRFERTERPCFVNTFARCSAAALAATAAGAALLFFVRPARAAQPTFSDVPATHWAAESVKKLAERGILSGYAQRTSAAAPAAPKAKPASAGKPPQLYSGDKPVTRYELAVTLYRMVQYLERADRQKRGTSRVQRTGPAAPAPKNGAEAVRRLIAGGYLPKDTLLATNGNALVTADQLADVLAQVVRHTVEKRVSPSPGSLNAPDEEGAPPPQRRG